MKLNESGLGKVVVIITIVVLGVLGFFGYQQLTKESETTQTNTQTEQQSTNTEELENEPVNEEVAQGTVITSGDSEFGTILFDGNNQAIYIWELEESETAECYDNCAVAWPPVLTDGAPVAAGSVDGTLLGTTERTDGTTQVTYNGHPLYYYAHEDAGEVKCHNIKTHGGLWWVIQPNGIRAE